MKKLSYLFLAILSLSSLSGCLNTDNSSSGIITPVEEEGQDDKPIEPSKNTFSGITFEGASFVYDGNPHSIYVIGAPDFAVITYENNEQINVGNYEIKATISANDYETLILKANLEISRAQFSNIVFDDLAIDYDGEEHSIYVTGAPKTSTIRYKNNGRTSVGSQTVTATITDPNYVTLTKTAILTIVGKEISGITFEDETFTYDGSKHSLEIKGDLPNGVSVYYTNNNKTNAGTYEVVAKLSGDGYEPLELKAKLIINPAPLSKPGYFYDKYYIYDGQNHSITVSNPPSSATVTYKCLNASGTNTFKNPGRYEIEATVKVDNNYFSVLKATMLIFQEGNIGVDSSREELKIDENLKWDDLYNALDKDNYSYDYYDGSYDVTNLDDPRPSDLLTESCSSHDLTMHFAVDGKQAYSKSYSTYSDPYYSYHYYKEVGDDIASVYLTKDDGFSTMERFPKAAFSETICKPNAADAFVALQKGENGEFNPGIDGDDYYSDVGYPFIEEDKFIVLMEHPRSLDSGYRYFYRVYVFYNIGNSTVTIPDNFPITKESIKDDCEIGDYRLGGVKYRLASYGSYSNLKTYYSAELYVSYATKIFLKPGTYTVLPYIYDEPVRAIVHYSYYNQYYNYDQSGYTFNLYIDNEGNYQGEYAELGYVNRLDIRDFTSDDGVINYYDDWHN